MTDHPPPPKPTGGSGVSSASATSRTIAETCRCGGSTTVTTDTLDDAQTAVREWRTTHPCTTQAEADAKGATGGGAQLGFALGRRHEAHGHIDLEVRAQNEVNP